MICLSIGCMGSNVNAETKKSEQTIEICYYSSTAILGDFPINIYLDGKKIGLLEYNNKLKKEVNLAPGKHTLKFEKKKKKKVNKTLKFKVTKEKKYYNFEVYTPKRKIINAHSMPTDSEILSLNNHPKVLDSIELAEESWRQYDEKKIGIYNPDKDGLDDPMIPGNYIATVECNMSRWVSDLRILPSNSDELYIKDAKSAVKFIRDYVDLEKLKKYYGPGDSYKVFTKGKESDVDSRTYVISYYSNEEGRELGYPEYLYVEIDKSSLNAPVDQILVWWRGRPGSSRGGMYQTYEDWGPVL